MKLRKTKFFSQLKHQVLTANQKPFLFYKLTMIGFVGFIILLQVFILKNALNGEMDNTMVANSGFINIYVIRNKGVGFSLLQNQTGLVYFLQGLLSVIALVFLVFMVKYSYIFWITTLAFGSLGNFFDRLTSANDSVLDYFIFQNGSSVFNFADCCITFGFIGLFFCF
ncbi:signal peptidase II [Mycoplasmoides genitalium M6282]|nr:signal peptidase II [Mycoplasmoides genitalium M6282]